MHMIKVLRQGDEMIPNVPRCCGSGTHKYGGLLGVVVLVAGSSIHLWICTDNRSSKVKSVGFYISMGAGSHLYVRVLYAFRILYVKVPRRGWIPAQSRMAAVHFWYSGLMATIMSATEDRFQMQIQLGSEFAGIAIAIAHHNGKLSFSFTTSCMHCSL